MSALKYSQVIVLILIIDLISGCSVISVTPVPTPYPTEYIPTVIAKTLAAQGIELPSNNQSAGIEEPTVTQAPTLEPKRSPSPIPEQTDFTVAPLPSPIPPEPSQNSPPPDNVPTSIIQIINPGTGSKVLSPFILRASVKPGSNAAVRIELLGEDGRLLTREVRRYSSLENEWVSLGGEVSYGINSVAEIGHLQIGIEDEHGRLHSVSSVDLILQSMGNQDLFQPVDLLEDIILLLPKPNRLIQGGTMRIDGLARPRTGKLLMIEIVSSDGRIVGTRQVSVTPQSDSSYGTFTIDVPYKVDYTTRVRVKVWEPGESIPGIVNLSSVEVLVSP